jgi:hypothetical protein
VRVCAGRRRREWCGREARVSVGVERVSAAACVGGGRTRVSGFEQSMAPCSGVRRRLTEASSRERRRAWDGGGGAGASEACLRGPSLAAKLTASKRPRLRGVSEAVKITASKRSWCRRWRSKRRRSAGGRRVGAYRCGQRARLGGELWCGMAVDGGVRGTEASSRVWSSLECGVRRASQRLPAGRNYFFLSLADGDRG